MKVKWWGYFEDHFTIDPASEKQDIGKLLAKKWNDAYREFLKEYAEMYAAYRSLPWWKRVLIMIGIVEW